MFEAGYAAAAGRHGAGVAISFSDRDPFAIAPAPALAAVEAHHAGAGPRDVESHNVHCGKE